VDPPALQRPHGRLPGLLRAGGQGVWNDSLPPHSIVINFQFRRPQARLPEPMRLTC